MTTKYQIVPEPHGKRTSYKLQSMDNNQYGWADFISPEPTLEALSAKAKLFGLDINNFPTAQVWTNEECDDLITLNEIAPYFGDYIYEVTEINGNKLTIGLIVDVLMDNATWPAGMTPNQIERTARRLARKYLGK